MDVLTFDVALAAKLKKAMNKAGWTEKDINLLSESSELPGIKQVLLGHAGINVLEHVIDCDAQPVVLDGWYVEEHQKDGAFKWDRNAQKDALYFVECAGNRLREELVNKSIPVLNANVLDYLLAHPQLIPKKWKDKHVYFLGTLYSRRNCGAGALWVRSLYWGDGEWRWGYVWLEDNLSGCAAAVRAKLISMI